MVCNELFASRIHLGKPTSCFTLLESYFRTVFESNNFVISACQNLLCKHLAFYASYYVHICPSSVEEYLHFWFCKAVPREERKPTHA